MPASLMLVALLSAAVAAATAGSAGSAESTAAPSPASPGPPDPSAGERIDGRSPPPGDAADRVALRVAAAPVRGLAWLVLTPIDHAVGWVERNKIPSHVYEALTSDDRLVGLRPSLRYEPGYAVAGGARLFDRRTLGPGSAVEASIDAGARSFGSTFALEPPGNLGLRLQLALRRRNDAIFGGTHGETIAELRAEGLDIARYSSSVASAVLAFGRRLGPALGVEAGAAVESRVYGDGIGTGSTPPISTLFCPPAAAEPCRVDPAVLPGFATGVRLLRAHGAMAFDGRENQRFGGGVLARADATYSQGFAGDPSRHLTFEGNAGAVVPLGDRAFGVHLRGGLVEPVGGAPVPFDELLVASGPSGVRGLPRGRLRGQSALVGSLEYRWLLAPGFDALLFVDRGNAFGPRFEGLAVGRTFTSAGVALIGLYGRDVAYWNNGPYLTVQLAVSADEAVGLSFAVSSL